jgi:hypothetical protein
MPTPVAITPVYASGDFAAILEVEQRQLEDTIADRTDEQLVWRPNARATSTLDILRHLA